MSQPPGARCPNSDVTWKQGVNIFTLTDKNLLDEEYVRFISGRLARPAGSDGPKVIVNFAHVANFTADGIGALRQLQNHVLEQEGKLVLCGMGRKMSRMFEITKLDHIFTICKSEEEALRHFSREKEDRDIPS